MAKLNDTLSQDELKRLLSYDPLTGIFRRIARTSNSVSIGEVAGFKRKGAWQISLLNTEYLAHRLAWLYVYGCWPSEQIDHINCNPSDNRIENLRLANGYENAHNRQNLDRRNKSGFMGVSYNKEKKKWDAEIMAYGVRARLGRFDSPEKASEVYQAAKKKLHPFYAGGK